MSYYVKILRKDHVFDLEGVYKKWLFEIGATWFILRPDFYVAATANTAESLCEQFDQLTAKLYLRESG